MSTIKKLNIQWAAGLYEGEGSIHMQKQDGGKYAYPRLSIGSTDKDVLGEVVRILGVGKVYGPYESVHRDGSARKDMYHYIAWNEDALKVARRLRPYVNGRRGKQIDKVLTAKIGRQ